MLSIILVYIEGLLNSELAGDNTVFSFIFVIAAMSAAVFVQSTTISYCGPFFCVTSDPLETVYVKDLQGVEGCFDFLFVLCLLLLFAIAGDLCIRSVNCRIV